MEQMVDALVEKLKQSEIFIQYQAAKKRINENPDLKFKIQEFKKNHIAYQKKAAEQLPLSFDEEKYMSAQYWALMRNDDAKVFLESERALVQFYGQVVTALSDVCDVDMSFFE